jgi:hypothetical protein
VGLGVDDPIWDVTVFTKNRDRLLDGDIAAKFFRAVLGRPEVKALLSDEHFTVDGTLIGRRSRATTKVAPGSQRFEVMTSVLRRRRWPVAEKIRRSSETLQGAGRVGLVWWPASTAHLRACCSTGDVAVLDDRRI